MASNPRTFIDVTVDGQPLGRVVFELFADAVPKTAENFRSLSTGERGTSQTSGKPLHYKGAPLHRVIDGFMIQGGDTTHGNGKGGESIYGSPFADENLDTPVDKAGLLVMANRGPNTNSSQFFITLADAPHLNGKHVVFGRVVGGMQHIEAIAKLDVDPKDRPLQPVIIAHCGELERRRKPAPVRPRSASRSVSPSGSSSSDEPRRKKRKHRTEEEKAAKRAKKEAKRARKEAKRAKKLKRQDGSDTDEPGPVSAEEAARKAAEEEAQRQQREKERARLDEERKRELERLKNRLAAQGKQAASVAYRGRGEMRFREGGSGMHGW